METEQVESYLNMVHQKVKITIEANHQFVFNYVADLRNDILWRREINWVLLADNFNVGAIAVECSFLSKRVPKYIQELKCITYAAYSEVIYQTLNENKYYLNTSRKVTKLTANTTEFSYQLIFDPSIACHGLGFKIPTFIISLVTRRTMRKYMKLLKARIEDELLKKGVI